MRVNAEYAEALDLLAGGLNDSQVARATGIPRSTIRDWRARPRDERRVASFPVCPSCGIAHHDLARLPRASYAYLLGMYLGDGTIDRYPRTWRLRISLDCAWPGIARECRESMLEVFPRNKIHRYQPDPDSRCWVLSVYSTRLVCLFPQHGPGAKHLRPIKLARWQQDLVRGHPQQLLRGLIHSDGCRFLNKVRAGTTIYEYPRYNFTNASEDLLAIFTDACDLLGIEWRRMNVRDISIARRDSVRRLDRFVGPKR